MNKFLTWIALCLLWFIAIGLVVFIFYGSYKRINAGESTNSWQEVHVYIKNSNIEKVGSGKGVRYCLSVLYVYQIKNIKYKGQRYTGEGNCVHSKSEATQAIEHFRKYRTAYYNEEKPWLSVMSKGSSRSSWAPIIMLISLFTPCFIAAIFYWLGSKTAKSQKIREL